MAPLKTPTVDLLTTRRLVAPVAEIKAATEPGSWRFVISHEATDLEGDIVVQAGLTPVSDRIPAQVDHSGQLRDLIGSWSDIRTEGVRTTATLKLLDEGLTRAADLVRALLADGIRMAASIGFVPIQGAYELIRDDTNERVTGIKFLKSTLIEASVVVVPAQPLALNIAKRFGIEPERLISTITARQLTPAGDRSALMARAALAVQRANLALKKGG